MLLNDDIADIGKPDGICLPAFVVDEFLEVSSEGISTIQKSFFTYFFIWFRFAFFLLNARRQFKQYKLPCFYVIPLNNAGISFYCNIILSFLVWNH